MNPRHPGPSLPASLLGALTQSRLCSLSLGCAVARSCSLVCSRPRPRPSFAHARACSHARTRSLMCAVLLLAHARCVLARAFSCCRSRAFWEAQLSNGSKRARGYRPLMRAAFTCFSHIRSLLPLSHTLALSVALSRCALDCLRALRSRFLTHSTLSLTLSHALRSRSTRVSLARCAFASLHALRSRGCTQWVHSLLD